MRDFDLLRLIAINGYAAYSNSLMAHSAPRGREFFERCQHPQPGDLILETSTVFRWLRTRHISPGPALGWLLREAQEPIITAEQLAEMHMEGDYYTDRGVDETLADVPKEKVTYLEPLDGTVPEYRWTNASFITLTTEWREGL